MTAEDAIRYLVHEAGRCGDRDAREMLCLVVPAIGSALQLPPMSYGEALGFKLELREALRQRQEVPA